MATKQKSGLYRGKVKIGVKSDGGDIYKYISAKTKKELELKRQAVVAKYITGEAPLEDQVFGKYVQEWYLLRKEPFIREKTRQGYRTILNKHILPEFGNRNMRSIRPIELQEFLNRFEGASKSQISLVLNTFQEIFRAAKSDRIVRTDPAEALQRPKHTPAEEKRILSDE